MQGTLSIDYKPQTQSGMPCKLGGTLFDKKNVEYKEFKAWIQDFQLCWSGALPSMNLAVKYYSVAAASYSSPHETHYDDESLRIFSASGKFPLPEVMLDWILEFGGYQITIIINVAECKAPEDPYKSCGKISSFGCLRTTILILIIPGSIDIYSDNNVILVFPKKGTNTTQEIWSNKDFLAKKSPYFQMLFSSDFSESRPSFESPTFESSVYQASVKPKKVGNTLSIEANHGEVGSREEAVAEDLAKAEVGGVSIDKVDEGPLESLEDTMTSQIEVFSDSDEESPLPILSRNASPIYKVIVTETSHKTYRAIIYWLNHDLIFFARLSSLPPLPSPEPPVPVSRTQESLTVSPKSVYRLAHQLSLVELQVKALASFKSQLTAENVIDELFSELALVYDEIKDAAWAVAKLNWATVRTSKSMEALERGFATTFGGKKAALAIQLMMKMSV